MQKLGSKWWSFQLQLRDGKFGGVQMQYNLSLSATANSKSLQPYNFRNLLLLDYTIGFGNALCMKIQLEHTGAKLKFWTEKHRCIKRCLATECRLFGWVGLGEKRDDKKTKQKFQTGKYTDELDYSSTKKEERILDLMKQKKKGYVVLVMMKDL